MKLRSLRKSLTGLRSAQTEQAIRDLLQLSDPKLFKKVIQARRLSHHSHNITSGDVFIALPGTRHQGASFIPAIIKKAGIVIASHTDLPDLRSVLTPPLLKKLILVPNTQAIAADLAAHFYSHPSLDLSVTAITGTNGKTSLTWMLEQLNLALNRRTGVIGTISIHYSTSPKERTTLLKQSINTTPHAIDLQHALAVMREHAIDNVFLEASSHGLKEQKLAAVHLKSAIFTNLSHDHLDYHLSIEDYLRSKLTILKLLQNSAQSDKRFLISLRTLSALNLKAILTPYAYQDLSLGLLTSQELPPPTVKQTCQHLSTVLYPDNRPSSSSSGRQKNSLAFRPLMMGSSLHHLYTFAMHPLVRKAPNRKSTQHPPFPPTSFLSEFCLHAIPLPVNRASTLSSSPPRSFNAAIKEFSRAFSKAASKETNDLLAGAFQSFYPEHGHPPNAPHLNKNRPYLPNLKGSSPVYQTPTNLIGFMNGENLGLALLELAGITASRSTSARTAVWKRLKKPCSQFYVDGRMQTVIPQNPTVLIDYAHTPAALKEALLALRPYTTLPPQRPPLSKAKQARQVSASPSPSFAAKKLYVLFGCGGDRDHHKRPLMGKIAYMLSDGVFLSSDNARNEDPHAIIKDIAKGIEPLLKKGSSKGPKTAKDSKRAHISPKLYKVIPKRREAIRHAITTLEDDAIILIAGKGHERYENLGRIVRPFNEVAIILKAYAERMHSSRHRAEKTKTSAKTSSKTI